MDPRIEKLIDLVQENNQILRKMRRSQQIASFMRVLYWLIILGVGFWTFYILQPYIQGLQDLWQGMSGVFEQLQGAQP